MSIHQDYNAIFYKEIIEKSKGIVISYSPSKSEYKYIYKPFSHAVSKTSVEDLSSLMRRNLLFYAFGEEEVVNSYNSNRFNSLEQAAKYVYCKRLPERPIKQDGLPSEILLDLLVQLYNPEAYKLTVRTLFRQNDNNEIKGYDLTYFTKDSSGITIWLGQAKLGTKDYCKSSIKDDLLTKYQKDYLSKQLYFICDKPAPVTEDAKDILSMIDSLNISMINSDDTIQTNALISFLNEKKIRIRIPCLLAYGEGSVYTSEQSIIQRINEEVKLISQYYDSQNFTFKGFNPEIVFYIFPIESIERIRDKKRGFYAGLL